MTLVTGLLLAIMGILAVAAAPIADARGMRRRLLKEDDDYKPATPKNFTLPPLQYAFNALEPNIDNQTMYIHHDLHHGAYIRNLNNALAKASSTGVNLYGKTLSKLVLAIGLSKKKGGLGVPADQELVIRNNAGGAWNHALFWRVMAPTNSSNRTRPANSSALGTAIVKTFGSVQGMIDQMNTAATGVFGSGWAWLAATPKTGDLKIVTSPNQDNPLSPVAYKDAPIIPILGIDVWEHAYYLKYQNRRPDYVKAWFDVINWNQVALNYAAAKKSDYDTIVGADANNPK